MKIRPGKFHEPLYDSVLPQAVSPLAGRDRELRWLKQHMLSDMPITFVAVRGLPGVGKTALVLALLADSEVLTHFDGGILWASLGPEDDVWEHMSRWGTLFNLDASKAGVLSTLDAWTTALHTVIGSRRFLVVLDDVWQIQDALCCMVGGHRCAYVLTTRFPQIALAFAAEHVLTLPELNEQDSRQLLRSLATEACEQAPEQVEVLLRASGGLPLALTAMGHYLHRHTQPGQPQRLSTALTRLQQRRVRLRLSTTPLLSRRMPPQGRETLFLEAVIARSEQRLGETAQQALYALSVFATKPESFSERAATEIGQIPVEILDELSDAGLLESPEPGRYALHPTIADYGRSCLGTHEALERLVTYSLRYLEVHHANGPALVQERALFQAALDAFHELRRGSRISPRRNS